MKGLILLINVILTVNALPGLYLRPYSSKVLTDNQRSHCDSLCTTYDGVFDFDEKQKTCICYVGKYFDDTEVTLMRKNAKSMGMKLKTIKTSPKILSKRETSNEEAATTTEAPKKKLFPSIKKGSIFSNPKEKQNNSKFQLPSSKLSQKKEESESESEASKKEAIVGAARGTPAGININTRAHSRPIQHNTVQPLQPGAMKDVWVKARQRLDHLIKHSDGGKFNSRFAQSETQSIRNALKPLTMKSKSTAKKPLSRNSGGGLIGGGQKLKVAGKPLKPASASLKPFVNQPTKFGGPFSSSKPSLIKPRINSSGHHNLVGVAGPTETGAEVPSTSTTEKAEAKVDTEKAVDKSGKEPAAKKLKKGADGKNARTKQDNADSRPALQPAKLDGDFMEEANSDEGIEE